MQNFTSAPHVGRPGVPVGAPNAALLIDFDNVTMGIRSDLTRQLKELLDSEIIKGKVAVQRAYADWRRYAQYIVPLSEASVDLIFAPAYGSSKKNATDIRLAIDALELVFTRPEIGTFILLSGDSDFSSLVLKLKEYGKYVIGVGLRESASDLLVQNCDEYYSYSSLTGLTKAGEEDVITSVDPWDLARRAVQRMADENDVMRSDRLKQVMLELDANFDESQLGFSKFNKFLVEAASRNKLALKKLDNGQYEVQPLENGGDREMKEDRRRGRGRRERRDERPEPRAQATTRAAQAPAAPRPERTPRQPSRQQPDRPAPQPSTRARREEDLDQAYELLRQAVRELIAARGEPARDSDIKRQMLELQPGWDESELGFTKFSRFLRQAHDAEVIDLSKTGEGYYETRLPGGGGRGAHAESPRDRERGRDRDRGRGRGRGRDRDREPLPEQETGGAVAEARPAAPAPTAERSRAGREEPPATQATQPAKRPTAKAAETPEPEPEREPEPEPEREPEPPREEVVAEATADVAASASTEPASRDAATKEAQPSVRSAVRSQGRGRGGRRRGAGEGPPPLLPGQVVGGDGAARDAGTDRTPAEAAPPAAATAESAGDDRSEGSVPPAEPAPEPRAEQSPAAPEAPEAPTGPEPAPEREAPVAREAPGADDFDAENLGLPTGREAVIRYLSNSYQGVGQKTAEALIDAFGEGRVFNGLHSQPERVREILGSGRRTDALLDAWARDHRRRSTAGAAATGEAGG